MKVKVRVAQTFITILVEPKLDGFTARLTWQASQDKSTVLTSLRPAGNWHARTESAPHSQMNVDSKKGALSTQKEIWGEEHPF